MLDMIMPGALMDRTNNNLSNLTYVHSSLVQESESEKQNKIKNTFTSSRIVCDNIKVTCAKTDVNLICDENQIMEKTKEATPKKCCMKELRPVLNSPKEKKLLEFLKKNNLTEQELYLKLKNLRRQTKERVKPNRTLSLKLNRYYYKKVRPKWYNRPVLRKNNRSTKVTNSKKKSQSENSMENSNMEQNYGESTQTGKSSTDSQKSQEEEKISSFLPNYKADDDIRSKIKLQLELLRRNKRPLNQNIPSTSEDKKFQETQKREKIEHSTVSETSFSNQNAQTAENDSFPIIVNVMENYNMSDDENEEKLPETAQNNVKQTESIQKHSVLSRGMSIADMLLKREKDLKEKSANSPENDDLSGPCIVLTKTNDITKIKGWRKKHFAMTNNLLKNLETKGTKRVTDVSAVINKPETKSTNIKTQNFDDPVPSTSKSFMPGEIIQANDVDTDRLKQDEKKLQIKSTNSAFVSDMLDTFLTNHAELNISYEVPKLIAEEGITKQDSIMPVAVNNFPENSQTSTNYKPRYSTKTAFKPKTVAEKRRMLELDRKNKLMHDMEVNESIYLKKLERCEKRNKYDVAKDIRDNLINDQVPFSKECWQLATKCDEKAQQFAVLNGQKIRIAGSSGGNDLFLTNQIKRLKTENSDSKQRGCLLNRFSKPSLIQTTLGQPTFLNNQVKYKPGPLCKKRKLMEADQNWECRVLKMPKIKLVVYPEEGKRMPLIAEKYLQLCRDERGFISDEWAKFAVSAIRSDKANEKTEKTEIELELPYANHQNKLLVRKLLPKPIIIAEIKRGKFPDIDVEDTIQDIMSDMLDSIENQELDKIIIKDDPDLTELSKLSKKEDTINCRPPSPIDPLVAAIIKRPNAKRSKATLELRRLNVQVIEVDMQEEEQDIEILNCMKDYCKLGCVCKSLRGLSANMPEHCGREECMLQCSCSFDSLNRGHHSISLPAGTDILSPSTVVRLQDEAKRNLAKEERKFTQTVIKANNQTIMVGGGSRDRQRRVPKVPKKYCNYVQKRKRLSYLEMINDGLLEEEEAENDRKAAEKATREEEINVDDNSGEIEVKKTVPIWNKAKKGSKRTPANVAPVARINLVRTNLENVVPWCMVHNLYKCYCGGKALPPQEKAIKLRKDSEVLNTSNPEFPEKPDEFISYNPRTRHQPENNSNSVTVTDVTEKYCARTRALATNYYQARNKSQSYKARVADWKHEEDKFIVDFTEGTRTRKGYQVKKTESRKGRKSSVTVDTETDDSIGDLLTSKRRKKITLVDVAEILNPANVSENEKPKTSLLPHKKTIRLDTSGIPAHGLIDYDRSCMGLLTPSKEWLDKFHKMLNINLSNTIVHQIRLLEWATLEKRHKAGAVQLWFNNRKHNNIILTEDRRRPSQTHMNIRLFRDTNLEEFKVPEIITSLLSERLPGVAKTAHETYVILVYSGKNWEAKGTIVLNNTHEMCKIRLADKPTPPSLLCRNTVQEVNAKNKPITVAELVAKCKPKSTDICKDPLDIRKSLEILQDPLEIRKVQEVAKDPLETTTNLGFSIRSTPSMSVEIVSSSDDSSPVPKTSKDECRGVEITKIPLNITPEIVIKPTVEINQYSSFSVENKSDNIQAPLPNSSGKCRWFMLILENDFSVLRISFSNFHIKYTHLRTAIQMAQKNKKTVRIRSQDNNTLETPGSFGIYAVPDYNDRIFFGPYENETDHGLDTFRYVNGKLVNTKVYYKMRGSKEKKTTGVWFTHNGALEKNLNFGQFEENSSSLDSTEVTNSENTAKQVQFVDLTENDSDNETETQVDPLFNVLSADFSKNTSKDTNENESEIDPEISNIFPNINNRAVVIKKINAVKNSSNLQENNSPSLLSLLTPDETRKRKQSDVSLEPSRKMPTVIDIIDLDDDDNGNSDSEPPYLSRQDSSEMNLIDEDTDKSKKKMPDLYPINTIRAPETNEPVVSLLQNHKNKLYIITNIPGVGYISMFYSKTKYIIDSIGQNKEGNSFNCISKALQWLDQIFHNHILFMPQKLNIRFSVLQSKDKPDMPIFTENFLNGYHIICEKGIFDLCTLTTKDMDNLGFHESEISTLLAHKCELLIDRNIKILGTYLFGEKHASKLDKNKILQMAPQRIKVLQSQEVLLLKERKKVFGIQQQLMERVNFLLRALPESVTIEAKKNIASILRDKPKSVIDITEDDTDDNMKSPSPQKLVDNDSPKYCKIVDGKVVVMDKNASTGISLIKSPVLDTNSKGSVSLIKNSVVPITKPNNTNNNPSVAKPYPVNIMSSTTMQKALKGGLIVPITGLQIPATVVGVKKNTQKPTQKPQATSLLLSNQKKSSTIDLTD